MVARGHGADPALDQEHLLGNLAIRRDCGPCRARLLEMALAWASILGAAALANYTEILIAPVTHRAVGVPPRICSARAADGDAWRQRLTLLERLWYRWAPLIAGICLLTLLGAGNAHVDVLGHALGFISESLSVGYLRA